MKTAFAIEDEKTTGAPWFALKLALRDLSSYIHTHTKKKKLIKKSKMEFTTCYEAAVRTVVEI